MPEKDVFILKIINELNFLRISYTVRCIIFFVILFIAIMNIGMKAHNNTIK